MDYQPAAASGRKREYSPSPDRERSRTQEPQSPDHEHGAKRRKAVPVPKAVSEVRVTNDITLEAPCKARIAATEGESLEQDKSNETVNILDQLSERLEALERTQIMQGGKDEAYGGEEEQQIKALKEIREMFRSMTRGPDDLMDLL
ncbi:MAG: hypothetical protein M1812_005723 [Candelaria pacifica]|nr:MAG: hypothetical protein M1812_005723 [Candelaria pacifica]